MNSARTTRRLYRLLAGAALVTILALPAGAKGSDLLKYIPNDAVYCKVWDRVGNAPEGPNLRNFEQSLEDWVAAMDDIVEWRILKEEVNALLAGLNLPEDASISEILWGDRMAMAVLGLRDGTGIRLPALVLVSQPKDLKQAKALLGSFAKAFASYGVPLSQETRRYEGAVVESFGVGVGLPGLGLSYAVRDDLLVMCTNDATLDRILDLAEFSTGRLAESSQFVMLQNELPEKYDQFWYQDWSHFASSLRELKKLTAFIPDERLRPVVEGFADQVITLIGAVQAHGGAAVWEGNSRVSTTRALLSEERPPVLEHFFSREPRTYPIFQLAPRNTESVMAWNTLSLPDIWRAAWTVIPPAIKILAGGVDAQKAVADFQTKAGINIEEDLLSWMGPATGVIKFSVDLESIVPINHFALWLEVTDQAKADAFLPKLVEAIRKLTNLPVSVQTKEYEGHSYSFVQVPLPLFPYQPCMMTLEEGAVLCTNPQLLESMIDVAEGNAQGLVDKKAYKSVAALLEGKANSVSYADTAQAARGGSKTLERAAAMNAMVAAHDPNAAKIFMGMGRLAKLVAIFGICQAKASSTTAQGNVIRSEQREVFEDLPSRIVIPANMRGKTDLTDIGSWLPHAIRGMHQKGQKEAALAIAERMKKWLPERADVADKLIAELKSAPEKPAPAPVPAPEVKSAPK